MIFTRDVDKFAALSLSGSRGEGFNIGSSVAVDSAEANVQTDWS